MGMADEKQMLIEALKKSHDVRFTPGVYEHSIYGKAALLLEKCVEVVRCCDCLHCTEFQKEEDSEVILICWRHSFEMVDPTDHCSQGERKDNG